MKKILFLIGVITFVLTLIILSLIKVQSFDVKVNVDNAVGIVLDNKTLNFGTVPSANSAFKQINFINKDNRGKYLYFTSKGEIRKWLVVEDNWFYLEPRTNKNMKLEIYIPENTENGNYTGKITVVFLG